MSIELFNVVTPTIPLTTLEYVIQPGAEGDVVEIYDEETCIVEWYNDEGQAMTSTVTDNADLKFVRAG